MNPPLTPFLDLTTMKKIKRILVAVAGVTVLAVGIALVVLPGPAFLVIPAGLAILAIEFAWARRWLRSTKDLAKRSTRFISGDARDTFAPMDEATPIVGRRLLPQKTGKYCALESGGSSAIPAAEELVSIDAEALSRFEGEGGREAPIPGPVDLPLDNGICRRQSPVHQGSQEKLRHE